MPSTSDTSLDTGLIEKLMQSDPKLGTQVGKLSHFATIDSTNSWLQQHGNCGDICVSDSQSSGRGRRGNQWLSPATGNLYFSLCYCLGDSALNHSLLGLSVGIAVAEALQAIGLTSHGVKWPNDILWQDKKIGGILIETSNQTNKYIIGIGLNMNMPSRYHGDIEQLISCLQQALPASEKVSREDLIYRLIKSLYRNLNAFSTMEFPAFQGQWQQWDILSGQPVEFTQQKSKVRGIVSGIDEHGRIGIRQDKGKIVYYSSINTSLRKVPV